MLNFVHPPELDHLDEMLAELDKDLANGSLISQVVEELSKNYPGSISLLIKYPNISVISSVVRKVHDIISGDPIPAGIAFAQLAVITTDEQIAAYSDIIANELKSHPTLTIHVAMRPVAADPKVAAAIQNIIDNDLIPPTEYNKIMKEVYDDTKLVTTEMEPPSVSFPAPLPTDVLKNPE